MKAFFAAALGFTAATAHTIEIPATSFIEAGQTFNMAKSLALYGIGLGSTASSVTWGACPDKAVYDVAQGTNFPEPPVVGQNVNLNVDVIFNQDADVKGLDVNVQFTAQGTSTPITLYRNDFPAKDAKVYHDGDEFVDSIAWLIPSFAPLGHYAVTITLHGASVSADNYACLTGDFDIHN